MKRFIETVRFIETITQEDVDVARLTDNPVKTTEINGMYTVDLEEIADFNEAFASEDRVATSITLKSGHQRTVRMTYKELKTKHTAYFSDKEAIMRSMYDDLKTA